MSSNEYQLLGLEGQDLDAAVRGSLVEIAGHLPFVGIVALPSKVLEKFESIKKSREVDDKIACLDEAVSALNERFDQIEAAPAYKTLLKLHRDNLQASSEEISGIVTGLMKALAKDSLKWEEAELIRTILDRLTPLEVNMLLQISKFDFRTRNLLDGPILSENQRLHVIGSHFLCALLDEPVSEQRIIFIEHASRVLENEGLVPIGFRDKVQGGMPYEDAAQLLPRVSKMGNLIVSFLTGSTL